MWNIMEIIGRASSLFIGSGMFFLIANPQTGYLHRIGLCASAAMILGGAMRGNYTLLCFGVGSQLVFYPLLHCGVSPRVVSPSVVPIDWSTKVTYAQSGLNVI
jgi:hypothetical protein